MRLLLTKSYNTVLTIIMVPLTLLPLYLLLLVLPDAYTVILHVNLDKVRDTKVGNSVMYLR